MSDNDFREGGRKGEREGWREERRGKWTGRDYDTVVQ